MSSRRGDRNKKGIPSGKPLSIGHQLPSRNEEESEEIKPLPVPKNHTKCSISQHSICTTCSTGVDKAGCKVLRKEDSLNQQLKASFLKGVTLKNLKVADVIEMARILSPTKEDIAKLTKGDMFLLVIKNWKDWTKRKLVLADIHVSHDALAEDFQKTQPIKLFQVIQTENDVEDVINKVSTAFYTFGQAGSRCGFECLDYSIPCIYNLVKGARFWIMIKQSHNHILEKLVCNAQQIPRKDCLYGRNLIMSPLALRKHQIIYNTAVQREGDHIVTVPGTYYAWINLIEYTQVLCVHYTNERWLTWAKERETTCCSCKKKFTLDFKKIETNYYCKKEVLETTSKSIRKKNAKAMTVDESNRDHKNPNVQPNTSASVIEPKTEEDITYCDNICTDKNDSMLESIENDISKIIEDLDLFSLWNQ